MPDLIQMQFMQANAYLAELINQFAGIEKRIEDGETVTLNLTDQGRTLSLVVSRENVAESAAPAKAPAPGASSTLADNQTLVAALTKTFTYDLGQANRNISVADVQTHLKNAARQTARDEADLVPKLPVPVVTHDGHLWVVAEDCRYAALDGSAITAKRGFKSDLASIPRLFWAIIASFELSLVAPIMHDLIYRGGGTVILPDGEVTPAGRLFSRRDADDLFLELMTRSNVAYWKRNVAYLAVRAFGQSSWQEG
ncbi:MAG: hypothetical protein LZF60_340100 [Nitrospira sp.]|nr:DUF1353 domain-containing protein [Nitrospira sp.]ULA61560.1 MAG: hypothetical protein LZF60_340100 [Nitrospira sp.]